MITIKTMTPLLLFAYLCACINVGNTTSIDKMQYASSNTTIASMMKSRYLSTVPVSTLVNANTILPQVVLGATGDPTVCDLYWKRISYWANKAKEDAEDLTSMVQNLPPNCTSDSGNTLICENKWSEMILKLGLVGSATALALSCGPNPWCLSGAAAALGVAITAWENAYDAYINCVDQCVISMENIDTVKDDLRYAETQVKFYTAVFEEKCS